MAAPEHKIPIGLRDALVECGVSPVEVLGRARLPSGLLDAPGQRVSRPDYLALWAAIRASSADPDIGIALVRAVRPELTEPLFLAILSSMSVGSALEVVIAYKRLLSPESLSLRADEATGEAAAIFTWAPGAPAPPQALVDAELSFLVEMCRRGTRCPDLAPREVRMRATELEAGADPARYFRCPVRLGAPHDAVVLEAGDLARPFVTHNPQMLNALLPYLKAETPPSPEAAITRVRAVISGRLRGQRPTLRSVSRELGMSERSVQRLLQDHGTSFRELLDEVRNEHAQGYLRSTTFNDTEVAFLLGFEDPNSFYRAFRTWSGMSPSEFRRRPHA